MKAVDGRVSMTNEQMFGMALTKVMERGDTVWWLHEVHFEVQRNDAMKVKGENTKSHP